MCENNYANNNKVNESYEYETKAQKTLKYSSYNLSDRYLREQFMKNLVLHRKILSETSVQIDDLIEVSDSIEENNIQGSIAYNKNQMFNFCVNCGEENINKTIECTNCKTSLAQSFYE